MKQVDMSDKAITARLKRVSQLRRLCLSLQKAKLPAKEDSAKTMDRDPEAARRETRKAK